MADLNKFIRSKERITELLGQLNKRPAKDKETDSYINELQKSIRILDEKMEEFQKRGNPEQGK